MPKRKTKILLRPRRWYKPHKPPKIFKQRMGVDKVDKVDESIPTLCLTCYLNEECRHLYCPEQVDVSMNPLEVALRRQLASGIVNEVLCKNIADFFGSTTFTSRPLVCQFKNHASEARSQADILRHHMVNLGFKTDVTVFVPPSSFSDPTAVAKRYLEFKTHIDEQLGTLKVIACKTKSHETERLVNHMLGQSCNDIKDAKDLVCKINRHSNLEWKLWDLVGH